MNERRQFQRITVKRHAGDYDCSLELNGVCHHASLIDISPGGARFSLDGTPAYDINGRCGTVKNDYYEHNYLLSQTYKVLWSAGNEIGVAFDLLLDQHYYTLKNYYAPKKA
jgi:hypothetical protein